MPPSFYDLSANEQVLLSVIIAFLLSDGLNETELAILGNFIEAVGDNILLIQAVTAALSADSSASDCTTCEELQNLRARLDKLESRI